MDCRVEETAVVSRGDIDGAFVVAGRMRSRRRRRRPWRGGEEE